MTQRPNPSYGSFLDTLPVAALLVERDGTIAVANARAAELLGCAQPELRGAALARFAPASPDAGARDELVRRLCAATTPGASAAVRLRRADGSALRVQVESGAAEFEGRPCALALLREVDEREDVLERLRASEELLRQAVRVSEIGIFDHDHVSGTVYWSPRQRSIYGWSDDEPVTLARFLACVHPQDVDAIGAAVRRAHDPAGDGMFDVEFHVTRPDGQVRLVSTRSKTFFGGEEPARRPLRTVGAVIDVTERHRVEEQLQMFRTAIDCASDAVFWLARDGSFRYVNESAGRSLGYTRAELLGMHLWDVDPSFPPERWDARWREIEAATSAEAVRFETWQRRKDGSGFPVEVSVQLMPFASGALHIAFVRDITERKRAEAALRVKDQALETTINAVAITDAEGRVVYANPAFVRAWRFESQGELVGKLPFDLASDTEATRRILDAIRTHGRWQGELVARRKDGSTFDCLLSASAVLDERGRLTNMMGAFLDLTERKRLEAQFRQAQKMESVGRLAGGVAHDFNNLLTAIAGNVSLALQDVRDDDPVHDYLAEVDKAADSAADLTRQLLTFSRRQVVDPQVLDLNEVVAHLEKMLRRLLGEDVELRTRLAPDLGQVHFDRGQLEQIVVNLVVNARDAMPEGGQLTLETANAVLSDEYCAAHGGARPGEYVALVVADEGCGMSAEVKAHLFEPFFTTKQQGQGTGLGLAMVFGAVEQGRGSIEVESEVGRGTTFRIHLPRVSGTPQARAPHSADLPARVAATIVLVEDDAQVRSLATRMLTRLGYTVHAFANGADALAAAKRMDERVDLLLTDVVLPGIGGPALAREFRALRPALKVLLTSGYARDLDTQRSASDPRLEFVAKPYSFEVLARRVHELLQRAT